MKKQTLCSICKRFLLVVVFAGSPWIAGAQTAPEQIQSDSISMSEPVIRFLGADAGYYYLQLQLDNPAMGRIQISLKDQSTDALIFDACFAERFFLQTVPVPRTSLRLQWLVNCRPTKTRTGGDLAIW